MATIMEALGGHNGETIMEALGGNKGETIAEVVMEHGVDVSPVGADNGNAQLVPPDGK